jgi:uncharacterized protein (DUF58 family)
VGFNALREYVPGDDYRLVHWRSSARLGTLLVRERMSPDEARLTVLLDTSTAGYAAAADPAETFEDAVRVAASVTAAAQRHGQPVTLRCTGGPEVSVPGRRAALGPALDLLAAAGQAAGDPGLRTLGGLVADHGDASLLVVSGPGADPGPAAWERARRRFALVTLVLVGRVSEVCAAPPGVTVIRAGTSSDLARRAGR